MKAKILILFALLTCAGVSSAQTRQGAATTPTPQANKSTSAEKPKRDIDSFFKDGEKQTRKAQKEGGANCVPKPKNETPVEPIT